MREVSVKLESTQKFVRMMNYRKKKQPDLILTMGKLLQIYNSLGYHNEIGLSPNSIFEKALPHMAILLPPT